MNKLFGNYKCLVTLFETAVGQPIREPEALINYVLGPWDTLSRYSQGQRTTIYQFRLLNHRTNKMVMAFYHKLGWDSDVVHGKLKGVMTSSKPKIEPGKDGLCMTRAQKDMARAWYSGSFQKMVFGPEEVHCILSMKGVLEAGFSVTFNQWSERTILPLTKLNPKVQKLGVWPVRAENRNPYLPSTNYYFRTRFGQVIDFDSRVRHLTCLTEICIVGLTLGKMREVLKLPSLAKVRLLDCSVPEGYLYFNKGLQHLELDRDLWAIWPKGLKTLILSSVSEWDDKDKEFQFLGWDQPWPEGLEFLDFKDHKTKGFPGKLWHGSRLIWDTKHQPPQGLTCTLNVRLNIRV